MEMKTQIDEFISWLEATNKREKQYAVKNTLVACRRNLERLARFLKPDRIAPLPY